MGASAWSYVAPWQGNVEETFSALQEKVLAEYFSSYPEEDRPAALAELWSGDEDDEQTLAGFMATQGTHTILDIRLFVTDQAAAEDAWTNSIMECVPATEVAEVFGHSKPSVAEFNGLAESSALFKDYKRGSGRCLVLYRQGFPEAVAFWGCSGD